MPATPRMRLEHRPGVIGVDEAGRGPLAGPVVVSAVILPLGFDIRGLNDSKKLTRGQRVAQAERIKANARWSIVSVGPQDIDRLNILWATMRGMELAVEELGGDAQVVVDGDRVPPGLLGRADSMVKGDAKLTCIAAASILAKTHRDALLTLYALEYPNYGFDSHFGYPTPEHLEALRTYGPCPIHRRSFAPVRDAEQSCLTFDT